MEVIEKKYIKTEVGVIPNDWQVKKLGELVDKFVNGGTPSTQNISYWNGTIPWITGADILNQKVYIIRRNINKEAVKNSSTNVIKKGSLLLVSRTGVGKLAIAPFDVAISQDFTGIYVNQKYLKINYLFKYLDFNQSILQSQNQGTSIQGITRDTLSEIQIPVPSINEQTAIASALSDTDELIESLEKLIDKKKMLKQGAMQQLLKPKKDWNVKKLGEICQIKKGSGLSKGKLSDAGKHYCILYGELFTTYTEIINTVHSRTNYIEGILSEVGDILFPGSTTTTGIDLAKASALMLERILLGGDIIILRRTENHYNSIFLSYFLNHIKKFEIAQTTKGITIHHLYGKDLANIYVELPSINEQTAIAQILSDMDSEIEIIEIKLDKYKMLKQGMMQVLLTGKIRLI